MFIEQPPEFVRHLLYKESVWRINSSEKKVYLTFDDGPIPEANPWILETLRKYNIKATFFCVGDNVRKHPELFANILSEGHSVGNHTFNHLQAFKVSSQHYFKNIYEADKLINSNLFRPPHGQLRKIHALILRRTRRIIMWDVVTRDYSKKLTAQDVFDNVKKYARNGSVIVFHDSLKSIDKLKTALPQSIEWLKSQGYSFEKIEMKPLF
ncbi:MAG: polysaccharide deacetylase family protein [Paludibacteraceae bacterium]|nr:polysaccharide deacetylase family protein [Paludibacteraceae bacterium]